MTMKDSNSALNNIIITVFFSYNQDILSVRNKSTTHTAEPPHQQEEICLLPRSRSHPMLPFPFLFKVYLETLPRDRAVGLVTCSSFPKMAVCSYQR